MSNDRVRPPCPVEVLDIQRECKRMGLQLSTDEIRKVLYATDLVYDHYARATLAGKESQL